MTLCEHLLLYLAYALPILGWFFYLTWEMKHYKRKDDSELKWWEKDIEQHTKR